MEQETRRSRIEGRNHGGMVVENKLSDRAGPRAGDL